MKKRILENFNWSLWWAVFALIGIGLVNLYSALHVWGEPGLINLFWHQLSWLGIGFLILIVFVSMDYRFWYKLCWSFYGLSIFLLLLVLLVGKVVSGHKSWLGFGSFAMQPSEFAKLGLVFVLAKYFSDRPQPMGYGFRELLKPLGLTLLPLVLILIGKDLGSSLFFPLIFGTLAFVAKIKKRTVIIFFCLVSIVGVAAYQYGLKEYQKDRIRVFLNPEADPKKGGYHLIQSKIAVGSGRIFGKGYLKGEINKLRYLPEKHTDFIFPVLAEEWGFVGSIFTLGLYAFIIWSGLNIAMRAREPFGAFLATGVVAIFFWHLAINVCGVLGMIPLTGVPLPFLSYGGSSTIAFLIGVGLLLNIHMRRFMF